MTETPPEPVTALAASPSGDRLAVAVGGSVRVVSLPEGRPIAELPIDPPAPQRIAFSPDGGSVATVAWDDGTVRVYALDGHRATPVGEPRHPSAPLDREAPLSPGEVGDVTCLDLARAAERAVCLRESGEILLCDGGSTCAPFPRERLPPRPSRLLGTPHGVVVAGDGPTVALIRADGSVRPVFVDGVVDRGARR